MKRLCVLSLGILAAFAGCTRNTIVIVNPNPQLMQMAANQAAAKPCFLSDSEKQKYTGKPEMTGANVNTTPQKAKDAHMNGCAGAEFQLDANGQPININIIKEQPKDYGFGDALTHDLQVETFKAPTDPSLWYYRSSATVFNPAAH